MDRPSTGSVNFNSRQVQSVSSRSPRKTRLADFRSTFHSMLVRMVACCFCIDLTCRRFNQHGAALAARRTPAVWRATELSNRVSNRVGKKTPVGAGTHTGHTRDTRAHTRTGNSNTDFRNETHAEKDRTPFGHFTTLRRYSKKDSEKS